MEKRDEKMITIPESEYRELKEAVLYLNDWDAPKPHSHGRKLTPDQVHQVKELRKAQYKLIEISELLGISISTIKDICSGRAYASYN